MNIALQLRQQLLGNTVIGRCEQESGIVFQKGMCSETRCIRFTTNAVEAVLPTVPGKSGVWKTGRLLQYEIYNDGVTLRFQLSLSSTGMNSSQKKEADDLVQFMGGHAAPDENGIIEVHHKDFPIDNDLKNVQQVLDGIFVYELPNVEEKVMRWVADRHQKSADAHGAADETELIEGEEIQVRATKYERNPVAREQCIKHYGAVCRICGFDFGTVYGPEFAGIIEVHHIVPLSEIREGYVVDPIQDLIPVCSNCHTALHSKKDGVYLPEEVRATLKITS